MTTTSLAVVARDYGGPEVLDLVPVEVPAPGPGQVQLEVRAAGINPADIKRYGGAFGRDPAQLPLRIGSEVAGVVTAVGPDPVGVQGPIRVGDEVIGFRVSGGYAQRITVPAGALLTKPAELGWPEASGLMLTGVTAVHALTATRVGPGDTVLVHAAAGGVGQAVIQLARAQGARVIGTARPAGHDLLTELGAEPVDYGPGLVDRVRALAPDGVTVAVDLVGTDEAVEASVALVADRSRIATVVAFGRAAERGLLALGGGPGADPGTELRDRARLELVQEVAAGRLQVRVERTFPLAEVAQAHRRLLTGHTHGKLVLLP